MPIQLTDKNFQKEVLESEQVVLVDFWAPWCGPCKMMAPVVKKLSEMFAEKEEVKIAKLNVDHNQKTASQYGISGIPTIIIFKGGKVQEQIVGAKPISALKETIEKYLE